MIIADTDVLIDALNGHEPSRGRVLDAIEAGSLATTVITQFELMSGARTEKRRKPVEDLLSAMNVLVLDQLSSDQAARFRRRLEEGGEKIGMADYLIAGICHTHSATLWTRNVRHFGRIGELRVETW